MPLKVNPLLVILGPTATGKTDLALFLAKKFNGEIISCDSRQVYAGLDIGTGKLSSGRWKMEDGRWKKGKSFWQIDGIKVWMYDIASPKRQYNVSRFAKDAEKIIKGIYKKKKLPVLVGGTGLYINALLEGFPNLSIPVDRKLRKQLEKLSTLELQGKLQSLSRNRWNQLNSSDRENPRRLIRAIELVGVKPSIGKMQSFDALKIGLTAPREILYQRIDERVNSRIKQGMINEAKTLRMSGLSLKRMKQLGLEYGVLADYLEGEIDSPSELIKIMQNKIHNFVRRQTTWFKKAKDVFWFDITEREYTYKIEKLIGNWYD